MHFRKASSSRSASSGPLSCALALFVVADVGLALGACVDSVPIVAVPGDAGADGTMVASDASLESGDATLVAPDAVADATDASDATAAEDAMAAEASCAVDFGPLDDAQVTLGQQLLYAKRCSSCHGVALSGNYDGVQSPTTEGGFAYPPNLTSDPATGLGCWTDDQIVNAILNGIDNQGMLLCPPMPRWGHIDGGLDQSQAYAVVQYLRSLPTISQAVPNTPDCAQPSGDDASADVQPEGGGVASGDASDAGVEAGSVREGGDASPTDASTLDGGS